MILTYTEAAPAELNTLLAELKQLRRRRGDLPQEVLAARLDVVTTSLASWEAGREQPTAIHLVMWSRELGLRVAIIDRDGIEVSVSIVVDPAGLGADDSYSQRELRRLSAALRSARSRRRLSQAALAARLGVNRRSITRWETAQGYPRPIGLVLWARALECNVRLVPI